MTQIISEIAPEATKQNFPIVGIGASAGGLEAFRQFLSAIPEDSGMAFVLVQHLDPKHNSILPEILSHSTKIPVHEITDEIHLAPNNIYVIPENKILISTDGVLQISPRGSDKRNHAIDIFFKSLAQVHLDLAIGVVLSGTGTDGTLGLLEIKAHGGTTFAQDPETSSFEQMPESAINAHAADFVLPAAEIPEMLMQIMYEGKEVNTDMLLDDTAVFQEIISLLSKQSGVDFTHYKESTVNRRIARQMALHNKISLTDYLKLLRDNKQASTALFNDLLIPVTSFFRDVKIFDQIPQYIWPALLKKNEDSKSIRIWSAGCSSGEEPYSLAISLMEFLGESVGKIQIKIFASDISEISLAKARTGLFSSAQVSNVPEGILKKYFVKKGRGYEVCRQIRDLCVFAKHNFLKDPPFAKMDLISCRNVLIYMDSFLQKKALSTFHYALSEGGFLMLGKSEAVVHSSLLFNPFPNSVKIFTRRQVSGHFSYETTIDRKVLKAVTKPKTIARDKAKSDFLRCAEAVLLSTYIPPSVIINDQFDVVHFNGDMAAFLKPSAGKATFNLLKIAKEGLAFELRNAIHKAKETQELAARQGIHVLINDVIADVDIIVQPLADTVEPHYLILFEKHRAANSENNKSSEESFDDSQKRISILEKELLQTHSDVNAVTDDLEASNQELQSANEELLSGSEELQSLNEELETSKEELQSTNEELNIINEELINKQEEINISMEYTNAIVATLREPIVILDTELRIKSINKSFSTKYDINDKEASGKLIYEILGHLFSNVAMQALLVKVLSEKAPLEDYQIAVNLRPDAESIMLLNARQITNKKSNEKLILLAIEDITERKRVKARLQELSDGFETKVKERTSELESSVTALHKLNLRLQQFSHIASHDLQEPLRKILIFASILQQEKDKLSETGASLIGKISNSAARMKMLVNDLLAYSNLRNDDTMFLPIDLNIVLDNILVDFELLIQENNVDVIRGKLPTIKAIPLQMNQLFYNLIGNALKFRKSGSISKIELSSTILSAKQLESYPELSKDLSWCDITFSDNGIGFEQQHERQIFTIFQRLHSIEDYEGTGIGLSISSKIVENHHGLIFAKSEPGKGAAFHVILPVGI